MSETTAALRASIHPQTSQTSVTSFNPLTSNRFKPSSASGGADGIAKAVSKHATVYHDSDANPSNNWMDFRFLILFPIFILNFLFCFCRGLDTFGRWQKKDGKSIFITGIPPMQQLGRKFCRQPLIKDLCCWKQFLASGRDVKV